MKPAISIIVPAFEEETRLTDPVRKILTFVESEKLAAELIIVDDGSRLTDPVRKILTFVESEKLAAELIIVDDGSRDQTFETSEKVCTEFPAIQTKVIRYEENRGKGFAIKTGLLAAQADIALFSDADLSTPIEEIYKLVKPIQADEFDVAFGSRALDRSLIGTHQPWRREQGGKVMNLIIRTMSGLKFHDTQCGFKAFNMKKFRPLLDVMTIDRFGFDVEFLFVADYHKLRLKEIPVRWNNVEGSKVSVFRDTRRMITELAQIRRNAKTGVYDKIKS